LRRISDQILSFKLGFTNIFLIRLSDGYLLVDTSYENKYPKFLKELKKAKIDLTEINHLCLTHHHDDHTGFAKRILEETSAKLIVHNNAIPFLRLGKHDTRGVHWNWWLHKLLSPLSKALNHNYPSFNTRKNDIIIYDNKQKKLTDLGLKATIIPTQGHSSDSISIILDNGETIVGDAAMNLLNLGETKYRPFFIYDIEKIFRSWRTLIKFGAKTILPAHGKPFLANKLSKNLPT
jgi:glyoxylase-like metal-dependent hydrolase (beta-lactamase superfamily II)